MTEGRWFYTADLHIGHVNIVRLANRPFESVEHMNETIVGLWNAVVRPEDTVVILGDMAMGGITESLAVVKRLQGRKMLISGNHDRTWQGRRDFDKRNSEWIERYRTEGDVHVISRGVARAAILHDGAGRDGFSVQVSHFPYEDDARHGDKYAEHYPSDRGGWLVHGHVHNSWLIRADKRMINVGVDVNGFEPVPEERLFQMIADASKGIVPTPSGKFYIDDWREAPLR